MEYRYERSNVLTQTKVSILVETDWEIRNLSDDAAVHFMWYLDGART